MRREQNEALLQFERSLSCSCNFALMPSSSRVLKRIFLSSNCIIDALAGRRALRGEGDGEIGRFVLGAEYALLPVLAVLRIQDRTAISAIPAPGSAVSRIRASRGIQTPSTIVRMATSCCV